MILIDRPIIAINERTLMAGVHSLVGPPSCFNAMLVYNNCLSKNEILCNCVPSSMLMVA